MEPTIKLRTAKHFRFSILLGLILLTTMPVAAMARGFYTAVDVGQTSLDQYCQHEQPPGHSCSNNTTAFRLGGGYQFNPYFGIEASYGNLGTVRLNGTWATPDTVVEGKFTEIQLDTIFALPFSESFSLLFKLGVAKATVDTTYTCCFANDRSNYAMSVMGVGAQYDISKRLVARTQYEFQDAQALIGNSPFSISVLSAGVLWKF